MVAAAGFVGWSAACSVAGWGLSLAGALRPAGYAWFVTAALLVAVVAGVRNRWRLSWRRLRWRRPLPAGFLVLLVLSVLGSLHAPNNIDALTYRLPRVLHWLDAGGWCWLRGDHWRMNYSAAGTEWLSAPVLALMHSARPLVVYNLIAFSLLPGLVFVALRGLGASGRAAWRSMWLAPSALGVALQAGGIGNDLPGLVYFVAAAAMAARSARTGGTGWLAWAGVALGLMTGVKVSNLALLPAGTVLVLAACKSLRAKRRTVRWALAIGGCAGLLVSGAPILVLNDLYTGHWSGDPANATGVQPGSPAAALVGNGILLAIQNASPPLFPWASAWNRWSDAVLLPGWRSVFGALAFPRLTFRLGELPQEEWAGLGLCFVALLVTDGFGGHARRRRLGRLAQAFLWAGAGGGAALLVLLGSEMPARLLLPFYFLPLAAVAVRSTGTLPCPAARVCAFLSFAAAALALVVSPARPLFPVDAVLHSAGAFAPDSAWIQRADHVYDVYRERGDMLRAIRSTLSARDRTIGFLATDDDSDWSLWQPLGGGRRVVLVGSLMEARAANADAVVIRADVLRTLTDTAALESRLSRAGYHLGSVHELAVKASRPTERWLVAYPVSH